MVQLDSEPELEVGAPAPGFSLPGADGETHSLASFTDVDAVVVVFTCNHCPYAKAKVDTLNAIAADYDRVAVVGINPNDADEYPADSMARMQALVADGTIQYDAYLRDATQATARAYGATCTPDPFLLRTADTDDDAAFRVAYHGRLDDALAPDEDPTRDGGDMRDAIDAVLAGDTVETAFLPARGCSIKWTDGE
ncbi:thioredoxin family protein [Halobacterium salinarum]|uniref:thioredoxin family protein n=1 Tax=Halobacterium salinarum TaxID=2242 RepID=UPI001F4489DF|nr:thioredoxin family protein [Halobacterium salinarum]MCF2208287.1 thioredoxin family protein [Halobacterium salinarum]MCF2240490.1 thioredoxin family protein [Halobacterium salinarum]